MRQTPRRREPPRFGTTFKLTLEYDGSRYSGSQEQLNARTVMGELRKNAEDLFGGAVDLQAAGRTDAGVHALGQVAHLRAPRGARVEAAELLQVLNERLPADIAILAAEAVPSSFHARHDAVARRYLYRISRRKTAFDKKFIWWVKAPLDLALMSRTARAVEGRHNFHCFRAPDPTRPDESPFVVVESATLEDSGDMLLFRIEASHFLWRMVRRIVGTMVKVGLGEIKPGVFLQLLEGTCDARYDVAAWTAPASGLFLESVRYPA